MVGEAKMKNAARLMAVAFSFFLYAASFEPWGIAECAYIFAVPAILAARSLFSEIPAPEPPETAARRRRRDGPELLEIPCGEDGGAAGRGEANPRGGALWLISTFAFSYAAWAAMLAWLRHVYPPAGWAAALLLPLAVSGLFVWPWFALLPKLLPGLRDDPAKRLLRYGGIAGAWVCLEWLRAHLFTGFPWLLLAHSQWRRPAAIQTAEFGGVWIVSFAVIFFNLAAAEYIWRLYARQKFKISGNFSARPPFGRFCPEIYAAIFLAMAGLFAYVRNLPARANEEHAFRAGMVQTDFAGILKWDDALAEDNMRVISRLTEGLKSARADVALWPEAATPPRWPVIGCPPMREWIESLSKSSGLPILMGNMAYFADSKKAQNGAFFVSPQTGLSEEFYGKRKLVPFGEYVPRWASFLGKVVPAGDMARGDSETPITARIAGKDYKIGPMICYEDIFPQLGRRMVRNGAEILFVCTNDSWYGREGGAWQHAAHSALQAAATRRPLVRSSNNGLSAVFDQYGRMRPSFVLRGADGRVWDASTPSPAPVIDVSDEGGRPVDGRTLRPARPSPMLDDSGSIYFRGAGYSDVVFYKNFAGKRTMYVEYGDWFAGACAALFCLSCAPALAGGFREKPDGPKKA